MPISSLKPVCGWRHGNELSQGKNDYRVVDGLISGEDVARNQGIYDARPSEETDEVREGGGLT